MAVMMVRVSQSKASGRITSRRPVETRITRAGLLYARTMDSTKEEKFKRDPLGVWRLKRPVSIGNSGSFRVWLEEMKDGN